MMALILAVRNLLRNFSRTMHTLVIVVVGIAALVVFEGFINEQMRGFRDSVIRGGIGHIQVAASDRYFDDGEFNPGAYQIPDADALGKKLLSIPGVRAVVPTTGLTALAAYGEKTVTLLVKAYPAGTVRFKSSSDERDAAFFRLGNLKEGRNYSSGPEIVLGKKTAGVLGVGPGDKITIMGIIGENGLNAMDATVAGVYSGINDNLFAYADYDYVRELAQAPAPSAFTVLLDRLGDTERVSAEIAAFDGVGEDLAIRPWNVLASFFRQVNAMYGAFLQVIRFILLLVTVFIIANAMTMTVFERMREIGTLRAVGTTRFGIFSMLFMEGGVLGFTGCLIGIGLGFMVCAVLNLAGGVRIEYEGEMVKILFLPKIGASFLQLLPVTIFAFFGSVVPARKAAGLTVAETLRLV